MGEIHWPVFVPSVRWAWSTDFSPLSTGPGETPQQKPFICCTVHAKWPAFLFTSCFVSRICLSVPAITSLLREEWFVCSWGFFLRLPGQIWLTFCLLITDQWPDMFFLVIQSLRHRIRFLLVQEPHYVRSHTLREVLCHSTRLWLHISGLSTISLYFVHYIWKALLRSYYARWYNLPSLRKIIQFYSCERGSINISLLCWITSLWV